MKSQNALIAYVHATSVGNPGPATIGYMIHTSTGDPVETKTLEVADFTANQALYRALVIVLGRAQLLAAKVRVYCSIEFVVGQMNGRLRVKDHALIPLHAKARELAAAVNGLVQFIPKKDNPAVLISKSHRKTKMLWNRQPSHGLSIN